MNKNKKAPKGGEKSDPKVDIPKKDPKTNGCTTYNTHRSSEGCYWESVNPGKSCVFEHFCNWCKTNRNAVEKHKSTNCEHKPEQQLAKQSPSSLISELPFKGLDNVPDFIQCAPDIDKPEFLKSLEVEITDKIKFLDRSLPPTQCVHSEHSTFNRAYFLELHERVKIYDTNNYRGARIRLEHNNINVDVFRSHLTKYSYPYMHLMQYVEFGFPLGLWTDAYLEPATRNHSSAYSYYTYLDSFVETELAKLGMTGPFDRSPWESVMISPMMTAHKKPAGRRPVFDASFGLYSLNKNTPQKSYHDTQYEFTFPKIDDLADRIAELGPNCFLWKRDLSRYFLQLKIDPLEYNRLGFVWRGKFYFFTSFVWGTRHAGYAGQWLTTAVSFIHSHTGLDLISCLFFCLNYADDFCGCEAELSRAELSFATLGQLLFDIGLVESKSKACPPAKIMTYLGVSFNTVDMCMHVDPDKIVELKSELIKWSRKTVAKISELQSILGKLLWVCKAVRFSRVFVCRIIAEVRKLKKQSEKTTLSKDIRKDFLWWQKFLETFSGVEMIISPTVCLSVLGDAYPQGGGSWNPVRAEYFSMPFPEYMCSADTPIHIKEFIIVVLCVRLWGKDWAGQRIMIFCDNTAVCETCTNQKPKDLPMQQLLCEFLFWVCKYNFCPVLQKISSKDNHIADYISRNHNPDDIEKYLDANGFPNQKKVVIPLEWYSFQADW